MLVCVSNGNQLQYFVHISVQHETQLWHVLTPSLCATFPKLLSLPAYLEQDMLMPLNIVPEVLDDDVCHTLPRVNADHTQPVMQFRLELGL
jgi:hypothetical protein